MGTITRAHLTEVVFEKVGLSRSESAELVESVLDEITDSLVDGESVKLSSFGSFYVRHKSERIGRNPRSGSSYFPKKGLGILSISCLKG